MGAHALLSASSAARWLNCPRSVRLTEHIKDEGSSVYAAEGTLHMLSQKTRCSGTKTTARSRAGAFHAS